jgi:glycosyltransferase involved in cell wall biosynthesis
MWGNLRIAAVIPARDEAPAIAEVVSALKRTCNPQGTPVFEVIVVCDNGSRDGTGALAKRAGATVVEQATPGYGLACLSAIAVLPDVDVIVFVDGDRSIYAEQCRVLLEPIAAGYDLVLGARTLGNIEQGALTLPQVFGNALAVTLIRWIWGVRFRDLGPFRAIRLEAYHRLKMRDRSYGWTVEMQVKAVQANLGCKEVAVDTRVRLGVSKISGTVRGVIGAGIGILGMIWRLWRRERYCPQAQTIPAKLR